MHRLSSQNEEVLHDIKSPLTSALLSCEYLISLKDQFSEIKGADAAESLDDIYKSLKYIRDLLNLSDINEAVSEGFRVGDLILSVCSDFKLIKFTTNFDGDYYLTGKSLMFKRVIYNIIRNSVEACGNDVKIIIHVWCVDYNQHKKFVVIEISDNGPGIPPEIINKVFKRGFSTKIGNNDSCGLGLYICKSIIKEEFFGSITVKSKVGNGVMFKISVPLKISSNLS